MLMYHGTVDAFLPSIQKEGLRPSPDHAWLIAFPNSGRSLRDDEKSGTAVFLTKYERHAIQYAETRVRYFAAQPGSRFAMFDDPDFLLMKEAQAPVLKTKPVLLTLDIPDDDVELEGDPEDPMACRFAGVVAPASIVKVRRLSTKLKEDENAVIQQMSRADVTATLLRLLLGTQDHSISQMV